VNYIQSSGSRNLTYLCVSIQNVPVKMKPLVLDLIGATTELEMKVGTYLLCPQVRNGLLLAPSNISGSVPLKSDTMNAIKYEEIFLGVVSNSKTVWP